MAVTLRAFKKPNNEKKILILNDNRSKLSPSSKRAIYYLDIILLMRSC